MFVFMDVQTSSSCSLSIRISSDLFLSIIDWSSGVKRHWTGSVSVGVVLYSTIGDLYMSWWII